MLLVNLHAPRPAGLPFSLLFSTLTECDCSPLKEDGKWRLVLGGGHAVLPIAKPWEAPRMSEANAVSGGKGRIHSGETG